MLDDTPLNQTVILVDTNVIIEAVRTATWNRLTGALLVETVRECRDEAERGDPTSFGYVVVSPADLGRLHRVHDVTQGELAEYLLEDAGASGLDAGEQQLFAHAFQRAKRGDAVWVLCSADKAAIRAAVRAKIHEQLRSLEEIGDAVGARPASPYKRHFETRFLAKYRTEYLLGG